MWNVLYHCPGLCITLIYADQALKTFTPVLPPSLSPPPQPSGVHTGKWQSTQASTHTIKHTQTRTHTHTVALSHIDAQQTRTHKWQSLLKVCRQLAGSLGHAWAGFTEGEERERERSAFSCFISPALSLFFFGAFLMQGQNQPNDAAHRMISFS